MSTRPEERILVALFRQESHSFVPGVTSMSDFELQGVREGADVLTPRGNAETDGYLAAAAEHGVELLPVIDAKALSGGPVSDEAFEYFLGRICDAVREHVDDIDGVMLGLHGAMITNSFEDGDGEILSRVRAIVGPDMPIAASFDLHTHMTARMAENADIIVGYQTCPHIDLARTGQAALDILIRAIRGEVKPVISFRKFRMLTSSETHDDTKFPNSEVIGELHTAEKNEEILAASLFATQPWMNVSELGWTTVLVTDDNAELGQATADAIARRAWDLRAHYIVHKTDPDEAIATAVAGSGVHAMSEGADSTTTGSRGDSPGLLAALLRSDVDVPSLVMVVDAPAAEACHAAGVGATVTTMLGGTVTTEFFEPIEVTGTVTKLGDGDYLNHYGGIRPARMGRTAVLQVGSISILIPSVPPAMVDYEAYLSMGLDPRKMRIVEPKSAGAYREYYEKFATCSDVDIHGPSTSDLTSLPFTNIDRPLWPWDNPESPW